MKIAIVGAGVVGIACAHELSQDGHEVTVFERRSTVAEEASFANGALIAPGWTAPWAHDHGRLAWPWSASGAGLQVSRLPRGGEWSWLWQWRRAGKGPQMLSNHAQVHQWVRYSQERQQAITDRYQFEHDRSHGMLVLLRSEPEAAAAQAPWQQLRDLGLTAKLLSADEARALEPSLNTETPLHGAIELGGEAVANCREFAVLLRAQAQRLGCRFEFNTIVSRIEPQLNAGVNLTLTHTATHPSGEATNGSAQRFDAVVVCAGVAAVGILSPLGLKLPLQAVVGHSLSAAVREPMDAPQSAVLDGRHGISIARLGQRVRVAGGAEWGRESGSPSKASLQRLYRVLSDWFPGAVRLGGPAGSVQEWRGVQATVPDGMPLLGASRLPGVWLNLGHGQAGWSVACGAARALADRIDGRSPDIDMAACSPQRYGL
ncbi:FAD-dependent oxidoreductase [Hydrogenophaga sp. PBL-H3]|uniref:FAD-dependent oxidoreductase n=1 Tax=Hydrogenophaga sp. PBL-H3 TaxID=434010 RepID=UPI00132005D4|nr:FAD-dependent oxidoreductase [Hydrogenophaga sp. PBL-H3]QHE76323.1 FAD-dependent oxidoreductase [Hydrogenophaga sp. PBL-H3]QHE80747.1 FAD-dependent oxidoreductase [Hydrogenophaga sp. PBL-H3]